MSIFACMELKYKVIDSDGHSFFFVCSLTKIVLGASWVGNTKSGSVQSNLPIT